MKKIGFITGGSALLLLVLFMTLDPNKVPAFVLMAPFALLFIILFSGISFVLDRQTKTITKSKAIKTAALCAGLPILLLVLQSIGQLTIRDVFVAMVLFAVSYFYISRATVSS